MNELIAMTETDPDEAVRRATELLNKDPDDVLGLYVVGQAYCNAARYGLAAAVLKRLVDLRPTQANAWNTYGLAVSGCGRHEDARKVFMEAWKRDHGSASAANVAMCYLNEQNHKQALEWAQKSLDIKPDGRSAMTTKGMAKLALGDFTGWDEAKYSIGGKFRKQVQFQDEPMWEGQRVQTLVAYGEQGLGDEIMYASCLEDAKSRCDRLVVECDPRLEGLFRRSFPFAEVHGTRRHQEIQWPEHMHIDASCPVGRLPEFFRRSIDAFPRKPYLKADPERSIQWRALMDSWGNRPKIGLAWSGGSQHNHPEARQIGLSAFAPIFDAIDADFVSLQYKDPTNEINASGLPIRHFKRACLTDDYDDTAALVAELDLVIGVHTSVHHLAGGLGVPSVILVPEKTIWTYAGDTMPWYGTAELFKQRKGETWASTINRLEEKLCAESSLSSLPNRSNPAPDASPPQNARLLANA